MLPESQQLVHRYTDYSTVDNMPPTQLCNLVAVVQHLPVDSLAVAVFVAHIGGHIVPKVVVAAHKAAAGVVRIAVEEAAGHTHCILGIPMPAVVVAVVDFAFRVADFVILAPGIV